MLAIYPHSKARATSPFLYLIFATFLSLVSAIQNTTIYANNINFKYAGRGWNNTIGPACNNSTQSWAITSSAGDSMTLHFVGATGLTLYGAITTDSARIHIQIDDISADLDLSTIKGVSESQCFPIFSISNLNSSANHVLTALHTGAGANVKTGLGLFGVTSMVLQQNDAGAGLSTLLPSNQAVPSQTSGTSIPTTQTSSTSTPSASSKPQSRKDSMGGLITGIIFGSIFSLLFVFGGLFLARRKGWLCWRKKGTKRFSMSKGISSKNFFSGGISNANTPPFDNAPPFADIFSNNVKNGTEFEKQLDLEKGESAKDSSIHDDLGVQWGQDVVLPSLSKDRTPSPAVIIEDYDLHRYHLTATPESIVDTDSRRDISDPRNSLSLSTLPAHWSNKLRLKHFSGRNTPAGSPRSDKFSIPTEGQSREESVRSGRISPLSVAHSWRTEDNRYSGITVKIATREVLRSEQPQFSMSLRKADVIEEGHMPGA